MLAWNVVVLILRHTLELDYYSEYVSKQLTLFRFFSSLNLIKIVLSLSRLRSHEVENTVVLLPLFLVFRVLVKLEDENDQSKA